MIEVVAEISGNHNGSLDQAFRLIEAIGRTGATTLKTQCYLPDDMTLPNLYKIPSGLWAGQDLYELYRSAYTPYAWQSELKKCAEANGMRFLSSPFSVAGVNLLESIGVDRYKLASFEIDNFPLIAAMAATGKPVIASTGAASKADIETLLTRLLPSQVSHLLYCVTNYPTELESVRFSEMRDLDTYYPKQGLSDHTRGITTSLIAAYEGAELIEKHITLSRKDGGPDAEFSLEPSELENLVKEVKALETIGTAPRHQKDMSYRRFLYAKKDLLPGEYFNEDNVIALRNPLGKLPVYKIDSLMGRRVKRVMPAGTELNHDDLKN